MANESQEIEADLQWREAELASLKHLLINAPRGSVQESALLRVLCALLYAHYEGFCKYAWDLYLESMVKAGVRRGDCKDPIALLSMRVAFKNLRANTVTDQELWDFSKNGFNALLMEPLVFDLKFETNNLRTEVLRDHCDLAMLPHNLLDAHESTIKTLIGRRHEIAHGKKNIVKNLSDYQQYEKAALLVMHELGISIVEALERQDYLK